MKKHLRLFAAILLITVTVAACASWIKTGETSSSSDQVATVVAMTLQALASEVPNIPTNVPETPTSLLPHPLYFLSYDNQSLTQLYRMEQDGKTKTQITSESVNVTDYDISLVDGSIAYVASNQLLLANADGSNRRVLVDGGSSPDLHGFYNPVFSPDGQTLAYAQKGLNLYSFSTGTSSLVIEDQVQIAPDGNIFPVEIYSPVSYSPDGTKLLVALGHWEVLPSHAVYDLATNALVRYEEVQDGLYCCSFHGGPVWSPDSSSYYGVASMHDSAYQFGQLWKVDARNGTLTRMFDSPFAGSETVSLPVEPFLASDGQLYFFFGTYHIDSGFFDAPVLQLVRSAPDGVANRTVLRSENFVLMDEALWAPDASVVVVAMAPDHNWDQGGGVLELYYTNGQKSPVWLAPFGRQMKWGS